jgi:hypothetical protein
MTSMACTHNLSYRDTGGLAETPTHVRPESGAVRSLTRACGRRAGPAPAAARATPSGECHKGSVGLCGRGHKGPQLMRKSLGGRPSILVGEAMTRRHYPRITDCIQVGPLFDCDGTSPASEPIAHTVWSEADGE